METDNKIFLLQLLYRHVDSIKYTFCTEIRVVSHCDMFSYYISCREHTNIENVVHF